MLAAVVRPFKGKTLASVKDEADTIAKIVPGQNLVTFSNACATNVLENARDASVLHLACHGEQHPTNPLASGFVMRDAMLTVARLMDLNPPAAFLAFLSACETAKGDARQPDQAIHLAAAMLFAGFKSVVATMW